MTALYSLFIIFATFLKVFCCGQSGKSCWLMDSKPVAAMKDNAVWVEGWNQKLMLRKKDQSLSEVSGTLVKVRVDAEKGKVTILVNRVVFNIMK